MVLCTAIMAHYEILVFEDIDKFQFEQNQS